ncbi:hypothetical protein ACQEVG_32835 [Streptomyces sp. CA-135486]|uniref:hypothetical protein n=1 Tax=Streptomyces sp. CA-135486 TaxID=3240049 RepID=UPI003D8BBD13
MIDREFERAHPNGKDTLLCVGLCRRRKDRLDFRELPTHGRAASCKSCEGDTWRLSQRERTYWELEQARQKLRMYQRFAQRLKLERLDSLPVRFVLSMDHPTSGDVFRAYERPYADALELHRQRWASVFSEALSKAHTDIEEERWQ